jgi:streptomycin 6-kinase
VTVESGVPVFDGVLRDRLSRRFGREVNAWLDELPPVLASLRQRWGLILGSLIQRGTVSVVLSCWTAEGAPAVLKVSPDRRRINDEADALAGWDTPKVPAVLAVDPRVGALLIEAIKPGTALDQRGTYPRSEAMVELIAGLHHAGAAGGHVSVSARITSLFDAGRTAYDRRPDLREVVPLALYEDGRQLAMHLATETRPAVLLHGDLTPVNILDGGSDRGLVAVDPAPCIGDPAFDTIDLLLWKARDWATITSRAKQLAPKIGVPTERALDWCAAFAPMTALELAAASPESPPDIDWLLAVTQAAT